MQDGRFYANVCGGPLYLQELCTKVKEVSGIDVTPSAICKLLYRHGKRVRQVALQGSVELRGEFMAKVLLYRKDMYVWLDENGSDRRHYMRKYGYAIRFQCVTDCW